MDFTIIIPARNEYENLKIILPRLIKLYPQAEILIIDGNSNDKTLELDKKFNVSIVKEMASSKPGKAVAMRLGAKLARSDCIIFFDADCSHNPDDIKKIISPIIKKDYLHVSGSRTLGGSSELFDGFSHFIRLTGSLIINNLISRFFKFHITDAQNGLRAFDRNFFMSLKTQSIHTTIEQECVFKTLLKGEPILELPTHEFKRLHGNSKINLFRHGPLYLYQILKLIMTGIGKRKTIRNFNSHKNALDWWKKET